MDRMVAGTGRGERRCVDEFRGGRKFSALDLATFGGRFGG